MAVPRSPASLWTPPVPQPPERLVSVAGTVPPELARRVSRLTLADVIDIALRNNPATLLSWAQARAAAAQYGAARAAYLPVVTGGATATRSKTVAVSGRLTGWRTQYGPTASLSYLLLDFGGRAAGTAAARAALFAAGYDHNAAIQNTVLQVETAYFTYMATRALLGAQESGVRAASANLAAAQERHDVGLATIADVLQARTALAQQRLDLETTQGTLQATRAALAVAMGISPDLPYDADTTALAEPVAMVSARVDSLIEVAVRSRPDLAAARARAEAAADQVRVARAALFPSLSLTGSAGRIYTSPAIYGGSSYGLTLGLSFPLFTGFAREYEVRAAQAQADAASARAAQTRDQVVAQVFTAYYALRTAARRVAVSEELLASATRSEEVAAGRYREGVGSILDLLTAQTALASARAQRVQARWQWHVALAQLAHDAGILDTRGGSDLATSAAPVAHDSTAP